MSDTPYTTKREAEFFQLEYLIKIHDGKRYRRRWIKAGGVNEALETAMWMFPHHKGTVYALRRKEIIDTPVEFTKEFSTK